jgi:hypothetical protein
MRLRSMMAVERPLLPLTKRESCLARAADDQDLKMRLVPHGAPHSSEPAFAVGAENALCGRTGPRWFTAWFGPSTALSMIRIFSALIPSFRIL